MDASGVLSSCETWLTKSFFIWDTFFSRVTSCNTATNGGDFLILLHARNNRIVGVRPVALGKLQFPPRGFRRLRRLCCSSSTNSACVRR